MDALFLSRIQFAMTSSFHYLYPPLSIGLGLLLVLFEGRYLYSGEKIHKRIAQFWTKIFALTFALGVATGLVQVIGFGTNWSRYSRFVGDVFGSALGAEGIFAFFLEAGFLGIVLFGWDRVSKKVHFLSTVLVCLGAHFSAFWIVIANSWMQTPAGFTITGSGENARAVVTDFWKMAFNPSTMDRLTHVILGCWLAGFFLVIAISAYYLYKRAHTHFCIKTLKITLWAALLVLLLQARSGDSSARLVAKHQPAKLAAMEGLYETRKAAPLAVFGWVDTKEKKVKGLKIPGLLSFLVHQDINTPVTGLNDIAEDARPPVQPVFQFYHLMLFMWVAMLLVTLTALFYLHKKKLEKKKWVLWAMMVSFAFPQLANQAGWITAEIGRQPWIVYGVLKTSQGVSPNLVGSQVLFSLILLGSIYLLLLSVFIFLLCRKIEHGPDFSEDEDDLVYRNPYDTKKEGHI